MKSAIAFILGMIVLGNFGAVSSDAELVLADDQIQNLSDGAAPDEPGGRGAEGAGLVSDAVILKGGTEVKLTFAQSLSSKHAAVGERVELRVAENIQADGTVVVQAGARVLGTVVQGKKNEKYGNSKNLAVRVDYIVVRERRVRLTGERQEKAKTNIGSATAATVGLGLSGLMIYMNQREAWIREGAPAAGYIAEDVVFGKSELASGIGVAN